MRFGKFRSDPNTQILLQMSLSPPPPLPLPLTPRKEVFGWKCRALFASSCVVHLSKLRIPWLHVSSCARCFSKHLLPRSCSTSLLSKTWRHRGVVCSSLLRCPKNVDPRDDLKKSWLPFSRTSLRKSYVRSPLSET